MVWHNGQTTNTGQLRSGDRPKCMATFRLTGKGMADRADIAFACPLSPSRQSTPLVDKNEIEKFMCCDYMNEERKTETCKNVS